MLVLYKCQQTFWRVYQVANFGSGFLGLIQALIVAQQVACTEGFGIFYLLVIDSRI